MANEATPAETRERPGCVLGIAFGLFLLVGLATYLWLPRSEPRDGTALLSAWFASPPGAPFEVRDAGKLMGGQEVVQLVDASAAPEAPRRETAEKEKAQPGAESRVDWARVEKGPAERPPRTLTFVRTPGGQARSERARLFSERLALGRVDDLGPQGGRIVLELGTLSLEGWSPAYVIERDFEAGGTFRDVARVDLTRAAAPGVTTEPDFLVLNAIWSRSEPCSKRVLESLVGSLGPR